MAYDNNQNEYPISDDNNKSDKFIPKYFRTLPNKKFLSATVDQLIQQGTAEKLNAYYGLKTAKAFTATDNYATETNSLRNNYQFGPATISVDELDNVNFYKDYIDYINQIKNLKGTVSNHSNLNEQEYYSFDPHIDFDKFINYREYYWLPYGPQTVPIAGNSIENTSTYTVTKKDNVDNYSYVFSPNGITSNPNLKLLKGQTYVFEINTPGMPMQIRTQRPGTDEFKYTDGITSVFHEDGSQTLTIKVSTTAPEVLYYVNQNDINQSGIFKIIDVEDASEINVLDEVIGKKKYTSGNGIELSNGMKIRFTGTVYPETYATKEWYVEGVGNKITLIAEEDLYIPTTYNTDVNVPFDSELFDRLPFDDASGYAGTKDYIVSNRASQDKSYWARSNKWFHKSVIEISAAANNQIPIINESLKAKKPIIEFEPNLKLSNFGTITKKDVDLIDNITTDVFSIIEGKSSYNIDGIDIVPGMRILFTGDTDVLVKNKIYEVKQLQFINNIQLSLQETTDTDPLINETVLIKSGINFQGRMFYFNGTDWVASQNKNSVNQAPFFELFTQEGESTQTLENVSQIGTKIISYKTSSGVVDSELGFALSYRSIENIGDIEFDVNLLSDTIEYTVRNIQQTVSTDNLLIRKYHGRDTFEYKNAWEKAPYLSRQPVINQTIAEDLQTIFPIDVYDNSANISDLWTRVYKNNKLITDYTITSINNTANVILSTPATKDDIVLIKTHSASPKNDNGHYETPINLSNNPDNFNIERFTFGEMNDHVSTIFEELELKGNFPGVSKLRDAGLVAKHGKRFVQHSAPINFANFHLNDESANIITAIEFNKREYGKFKRHFLDVANNLGWDGDVKEHVDKVLEAININKNNSMPFFFSDMLGYGPCYSTDHTVFDTNNRFYPLNTKFNLTELSIRSVNVYHNNVQLAYMQDYTFNDDGFVVLQDDYTVAYDDILTICEYSNTDGCFIPPTPSKLGLYPAYVPSIYIDETYLEPQTVIQGHDGSIRIGYNDFRDNLLLELEMRIYNNIKVKYDESIFNIYDYVGGEFRKTKFNHQQIDNAYVDDFIDWLGLVGNPDYTNNDFYSSANAFTFNYFASTSPSDTPLLGFWRGIYKDAYDTDRPHTHPWEILGFSIKPNWWNKVYGPAPYTSDNIPMWSDLEKGFVREPGKPLVVREKFARPGLASFPPATSQGKIQTPLNSGYIKNFSNTLIKTKFKFGDLAPIESAWRRSSDYPYALIKSLIINRPAHVFGIGFDRSRISRNFAGQLVYGDTNKRITLKSLLFPNSTSDLSRVQTAGLVNFVANLIHSNVNTSYAQYQETFKGLENKLGLRVAGFTNKDKFNLILDSRTPLNEGNVFVPTENYSIHLNKSTAFDIATYSGVIIEKQQAGFVVRGYDRFNPVFTIHTPISSNKDLVISEGGTSESFVEWNSGKTYLQGNLIRYEGRFYRAKADHTSGETFDTTLYVVISEVPIVGGVSATIAREFNTQPSYVDYGTTYASIQEVIDFLAGYEYYLKKSGFIFESFNPETETVQNWRMSIKDFLFWTTQNWQENSVITLSPAAETLKFYKEDFIVDNIFNELYSTVPLNSNGKPINPANLSYSRIEKEFILQPKDTAEGIYLAKLPLTQKEHIVTLDNTTIFQDVIYNPAPGYRQERIKVLGYRSSDWDGSTNVPGFIIDDPICYDWEPNTDYTIGTIVKYKEYYYVAKQHAPGVTNFSLDTWTILDKKPEPGMFPNFEYKANQFADFYDLDTDNFDVEQQRLAQHLIGYQKRRYLENILKDDVTQYKFYQGYIKEKGSLNALTKLFDSIGTSTNSLEFYEEWAFNAGTYGAIDGIKETEFVLDEKKFQLSPQPIELVNRDSGTNLDLIYRQSKDDVYLSDNDYNPASVFPVHATSPKEVIATAGYVHSDDVKYEIANYSDLLTLTASDLQLDDYIWIGNNLNNTWDVVKVENTSLTFTAVEDGVQTRLNFDNAHGLSVNDIFIIPTTDSTEVLRTVKKVENNSVYVNVLDDITIEFLPIRKFISHRFETISTLATVMGSDLQDATVWIDSVNNNWAVYKRQYENYRKVWNFDNDEGSTAWAIDYDTDKRNTITIAGSPLDGTVEVYARGTDSIAMQLEGVIEKQSNLSNGNSFGKAVAISPDSKYIAVGSPDDTEIKTNLVGPWNNATAYSTGQIVKHNDSYWSAVRNTLPEIASQNYSSFAAYPDIKDNLDDSTEPGFLLAANYPKTNTLGDHFLLRATQAEYAAVFVGSKINLNWLQYSVSHINPLLAREPFENTVIGLDGAFLTGEHIIADKVDMILSVNLALNLPTVGDIIDTGTGKGTISYLYPDGNGFIIYLNTTSGVFTPTGTLTLTTGVEIGEYVYETPDSTHSDLGGYWKIDIGSSVLFRDVIVDNAPGLIISDIRPSNYVGGLNGFYSIGNDIGSKGTIQNGNDKLSLIGRFKAPDDASVTNITDYGSKWFIRLGPTAPNYTLVGQTIRLAENTFLQTAPWENLQLVNNVNLPIFEGVHLVREYIDGYVKIQIQTDAAGTHSFQEGDTLEDANTGALLDVIYADWDAGFQTQTLYVNYISGTTSLGSDYADSTRVIRKRAGLVDRDAGFLVESSIYTATNDISKLIVFDSRDELGAPPSYAFPPSQTYVVEGYEFWIVPETRVEVGAGRLADEPLSTNSNWVFTNSIPVTSSGGTLYDGVGYVSVYERIEAGAYKLDKQFVIPLGFDAVGAQLKFAYFNDMYVLYVSASDKIIFVKKGTENNVTYDWEVSLDKNFRGFYSNSQDYYTGDIVLVNNQLYVATTNISQSAFNVAQWTIVDNDIDYTGYIPRIRLDGSIVTAGTDTAIAIGYNGFGNDYQLSENGNVLAAYVSRDDSSTSVTIDDEVSVYRYSNNSYRLSETITIVDNSINDEEYKHSFALSNDGTQVAIGFHKENADGSSIVNGGLVKVYKYTNGVWTRTNTITSPLHESNEAFGRNVEFIGSNLLISSLYGDKTVTRKFSDGTYFDNNFTSFTETEYNVGNLYLFENIEDQFLYAGILEDALDISKDFKVNGHHLYSKINNTLVNYKWNGVANWIKHREALPVVDINKFKGPFLYDKSKQEFIDYIDIIDPIQGRIAGPAEQELRYKTKWDPAIYTNVDENDSVTVDAFKSWGISQVGELWWDISTAKFKNPYQGNPQYQTNTWNTQFAGSSIDVYEWVESNLSPSEWREIADSEDGLSNGISGIPKYNNDTYVLKKKYDSILQSFSNLYYFWVKNKKTLPTVKERQVTSYDVTQYISDPRLFGYKYVELQSPNRYVINNSLLDIKGRDTILNFTWWTIPNQQLNIHNQYQIISDGLYTSVPSTELKTKWFDSLVGFDKNLKEVPDPNISPKLRYGNLTRPRQTWFVNRLEALKVVIERANMALRKQIIIDDFDLSGLNTRDDAPSIYSREYDYNVDAEIDVQFIGTNKFKQAVLTPVLDNGRLINVVITDPGFGYNDLSYTSGTRQGPNVIVVGTGTNAQVETTINSQGQIITATVTSNGSGYDNNTIINVRGLRALVDSDSTIANKWSILEYNPVLMSWQRVKTQNFDTTLYWKYVDWYATNYNQFTSANHTLEYSYELESLNDAIGDIVKINNTSDNTWLLLKKIDDQNSVDYSINYETVGRENGTIEIDKGLYNFSGTISGFDGYAFDTTIYDGVPISETRNILSVLFDNIFVDNLAVEYNKIFFASIRYILSEGQKPDWLFKTSFVKAKHNFGELEQRINYQNDNLKNYQEYINEVKPFKTKIREFVSSYSKLEKSQSQITDFDLMPWYNPNTGKITPKTATIENGSIVLQDGDKYPWKSWFDNATYYIDKIELAETGTLYTSTPIITFEGGGGTGATAIAYISRGKISAIDVTNPGSGYTSAPKVVFNGSQSEGGKAANATAIIKNDTIRKINTTIKFDRVSGKLQYLDLNKSQTFTSLSQQTTFTLKWPMDLDSLTVSISVNGEESLVSEYTYSNIIDTSLGYTIYKGTIEFATGVAGGAIVVVNYKIDPAMLTAGDRIHNLYKPTSEMPGYDTTIQDLSQVLDGIDYGGVEITSFDFDTEAGWDASGWYNDSWDEYDSTFEDEVFRADGSTSTVSLSKALEDGVVYNLYKNGVRIDATDFVEGTPGVPRVPAVPGVSADPEYNNGAISNVVGDGSDFFKREVTTNGVRIMGAGAVGGQTAVPDAWLEKVARMFELFTDSTGAGINETYQRNLIKTLSGDTGTYHAGLPTIQRVARGAGADYTPNFLTDQGVLAWNLTNLFDTHVQNDMVWYLNSTGDGYGDGDIDAQEVIEHVFHTLHMHGLPADDIKLYQFLAADWQTGDLYAAMEEAYDAGKWDPSGYQVNPDDWKTDADAFEVAAKEYLYLLNFCMFEYTELWDGGSLAPEWTDDMRTQAGIQANNPLGYAFHNTYIAPVISKPSLVTIRSIFQDGNTPAQDNPALAGASGYIVDVLSGGSPAVPAVPAVPGSSLTNANAITNSITGDGTTTELDVSDYNIVENDVFVVRKSTSDGAFVPDLLSFDTQLSGGNFSYGNASGHDAGEIIIDGDGFVTVSSSRSTDEHVPGQVLDTVDIKVFDRTGDGQGIIVTRTHTFNADAEYAALAARNSELSSLELDAIAQDSTLNSLQTQLISLQQELTSLQSELVSLEAQRDANDLTTSQYQSYITTINNLTSAITSLQSQLSSLQSQKSSIDGQISSLEGQISSLQSQISSLEGQISSLEGQISSIDSQISSLTSDLGNYLPGTGEYISIQNQITSLQSQRVSLQSQLSSLQSQLSSLHSQLISLQSQLSSLQSQSSSLGSQIIALNSDIIDYQGQKASTEDLRDAYEIQYNSYVVLVINKQSEVTAQNGLVSTKQSQVDNQNTVIANLQIAKDNKQLEINVAQAVIDALNVPLDIGATPIKDDNLIVRITGGNLVTKNRIVGKEEYSIDYINKTILFNNVLESGTTITTMVVGTNGSKILDTGTFIGDGSTAQFLTKIQHQDKMSAFVSVDGEKRSTVTAQGTVADVKIVKSSAEYAYEGTVIFEFGEAPADGALINYTLYDSDTQTFSEITIDEFTADGSTTNFELSQIPFTGIPLDVNILVIDNNNVLHTGYKTKFTATIANFYPISNWHVPYLSQTSNDISVYINGELKTNTIDYRWLSESSTLELFNNFYNVGDTVELYTKNESYELVGNEIRLVNVPDNGKILVYQFSEHNVLETERKTVSSIKRSSLVVGSDDWKEYAETSLGIINLKTNILSENYIWIALNGELLSPTIDYIVRDDRESVQITRSIANNDKFDIIHYTSPVSTKRFGYRQFKDVLNRTHYKRINSYTETILSKDLNYTDLRIEVIDGTILDEPNKTLNLPGIIFINGERIEYFIKEDNVLRQLRRGTLGTGVNTFVKAGSTVSNQGAIETIPYQDKTLIQEFEGDGLTTDFTLNFSAQYGVDQFEVFVGGKRLRKTTLQKFNHLLDQTSPAADETLLAEFSVHGTEDNILRLLNTPIDGQKIKVVRKIGTQWREEGVALKESKTAISSFLRESTTKLPE